MPQKQITFKVMADQYLIWSRSRHSQSWHENIKRSMQRDVLPLWAETPIADLRRDDGRRLITSIAARAPRQAAILNTVIRAIFDRALDKGLIEVNPMLGFSRHLPKPTATLHRRVLSPVEIKAIWTAISKGPGDEACKRALKLMIVTGQRLPAIIGMHRQEINGECWTVPAERCRGRRQHRVYLTPLALELIGEGDGYIFPSADPSRPITANAVARLIRAKGPKGMPYCGLAPWVSSDLRRTVAHQMAMLGISHEAIGAVFGLAQRKSMLGITFSYSPEIKAALLTWGAELLRLVKNQPMPANPAVPSQAPLTFGL